MEEEKFVREGKYGKLGGIWKHALINLYVTYPGNKAAISKSPALPSVVYIKKYQTFHHVTFEGSEEQELNTIWLSISSFCWPHHSQSWKLLPLP